MGYVIGLFNWILILQRLGGLSYFAGAEKKDERVLVPDLGSLTSVYDRFVLFSVEIGSLPEPLYVLWYFGVSEIYGFLVVLGLVSCSTI